MSDLTMGEVDAVVDEVDGDDEEEARRRYREKRMAEMKAARVSQPVVVMKHQNQ